MKEKIQSLEKLIISEHTPLKPDSKKVIKDHYNTMLNLIDQIMFNGILRMNEFQYMLMVHLFTLASKITYIPSIFIQNIAEMSSFTEIVLIGIPKETITSKSTDFLSMYYKIVSEIMNNNYIKKEKKVVFEKIVSVKLNENTVKWLIDLFTQTNVELDQNTKIMLKSITQAKFEFFEAFAENFKKTLYDLITKPNANKNTNWMNKYVFKIIEKCLIKLTNIEKDFITNLSKVCHSIIDVFLLKQNMKLIKLYQLSMRLIYIIYDRRREKNSKVIKFFMEKFTPILTISKITDEFISELLNDFIEVNFTILSKSKDLEDFYKMFFIFLGNDKKKENSMKYMKSIEKLFQYEMEKSNNTITEIPYIKKLLKGFTMEDTTQSQITIDILYLIIDNSTPTATREILEEITLSYFSFFAEKKNICCLEKLLQAIMSKNALCENNYTLEEDILIIYEFYIKYFDLLLTHALTGNYNIMKIFDFISGISDTHKVFEMSLLFANKYFVHLQNTNSFTNVTSENSQVVVEFLRLLAITTGSITYYSKTQYQSILNVYAFFVIFRKLNYSRFTLTSKFSLNSLVSVKNDNHESEFTFYLIVFARNIPELIFNKNTSMTIPIKVEVSPLLLNKFTDNKKKLPSEFEDFGDVNEIESSTQIYLICIYYQFVAKLTYLNYIFDDESRKTRYNIVISRNIPLKDLMSKRVSIISLITYATDNTFLVGDSKLPEFLSKMFHKFFDKYFSALKKNKNNTLFKQTVLSYDLKQLLNFACHYHLSISSKATHLITIYSKSFPFMLNEYDIFEYYVNVLGELICYSVKHYDYFISEIPMDEFEPLTLPSEKKTTNQIYCTLYKIFEKCLQKSHMINNNNITYNIANYMNQYLVCNNGFASVKEGMNYSVNLLQKIYNNIKKIEIPPMIKTTAYLDPEKFRNYIKTHVKKNFDKYLSISSLNDIYSPADYAKNTKLQIRNKYIGIIEGKVNNLRIENKNNDDVCYYKYKHDIIRIIKKIIKEEKDIEIISRKIAPVIIELTAFIVYSNMDINNGFVTSFKRCIIDDEIIHLITSLPLLIGTASIIETASFCWEWILYFDKNKISAILNNISSTKIKHELTEIPKQKNEIFDLENTIDDSIINARNDYKNNFEEIYNNKEHIITYSISGKNKQIINTYNFLSSHGQSKFREIDLLIVSLKNKYRNTKVTYDDYITGQITLLKFIKECISEFCKCDMEKLEIIYDIIKNYVDLNIREDLYKSPLYIYLHFFVLNLGLDLTEIMQERVSLFTISESELDEFKVLLFLYGLRYFKFDKQRRVIQSKFHLSEVDQTLKNCVEILKKEIKSKSSIFKSKAKHSRNTQHRQTNLDKVRAFISSLQVIESQNLNQIDLISFVENFKDLLIFLIDNEMNSLRYWNNAALSHKNTGSVFSEDKIKKIFNTVFNVNNKLCIKLIQRFPWINKKFSNNLIKFGEFIYNHRKEFFNLPFALTLLIQYIISSNKPDLNRIDIMKSLIFWKFPSLNYALKYISLTYTKMTGLHKYCVHMMDHAITKAIIFYLPQLIQSFRTDTNYQVERFILRKCKNSQKIGHQFLWALEVEQYIGPKAIKRYLPKNYEERMSSDEISKILLVKILKNLNIMQRKFWYDENDIFGKVCEISGCFLHNVGEYSHLNLRMSKEQKTDFVRKELEKIDGKIQPYIYLPTNPNYKILNLLPQTAVTLQSAKKVPFIMSFDAMEYPGPDKELLITATSISTFIENELYTSINNKDVSQINENRIIFYKRDKTTLSLERPIENINLIHKIKNTNANSLNKLINGNTINNTGIKIKENLTISDIILEEEIEVSGRLIEGEKNAGIFVPTFEVKAFNAKQIIHSTNPISGGNNDEFNKNYNKVTQNVNKKSTEKITPKKNDLHKGKEYNKNARKNTSMNVLGFVDDNRKEAEKFLNSINNTNIENSIPTNRYSDMNKKLNELLNCTLSDIEISDSDDEQIKNSKQQIKSTMITQFKNQNELSLINMSCIFKVGDDLRQDSLALQVIQIFQEIFKENHLNLYTYPYQTISTISPKYKDLGGFIEVVKDTDSRDQIGKTYSTNLYEYYLYTFGQENSKGFRMARKNLIESLAAYAIISYILQIKDRHNGNILIDKFGHLIHIDFGFIFDISPGGNMKFERAAFKLTKEMLKIMEGTESEAYSTFVDLTVRAFLACRDFMDKLLDPVVLMFSSGLECFRENSINNFIERFKLDLNEEEAANYMREQIKIAEDNWRTNVYDFIQKKQNNISY